jgi:charged multivesicular body protein 6
MGNSPSSPKVTAQDKAILQVKLQKDKLVKYQRKSTVLIRSEYNRVKVLLREGDKESAKMLLKKVKYQEKLIEDVNNQMFNLENMLQNIEFKLIEKEFLKGLQNGNTILKKLNKEMKVDDVEQLLEEVHESIAYQQEIEETLANATIGMDLEDEIDEELKQMEMDAIKGGEIDMPSVQGLPEIKERQTKEEANAEEVQETKESRTALLA